MQKTKNKKRNKKMKRIYLLPQTRNNPKNLQHKKIKKGPTTIKKEDQTRKSSRPTKPTAVYSPGEKEGEKKQS